MNGGTFHNMAPKAQRSLVVTASLVAVAIVIYLFCVQPCESQLKRTRQQLSQLQDKQRKTDADLKNTDSIKKDLEDSETASATYQKAMLEPLLSSYEMRAKSLLDPLALGAGLKDLSYSMEKFRALPVPNPMPQQLHTRAAIRVSAVGSYQKAVSFLLRLHKEFPLVSLQSFDFTAMAQPEAQSITFVLEWPAKGGVTRK